MSEKYTGLPAWLKHDINVRDGGRCRWCGSTNRGIDHHHIEYRRGFSYDVLDNLVSLCRAHHSFVHGISSPTGATIVKPVAQLILKQVIATPGLTGSALWRRKKREWALAGLCEHGSEKDECRFC